MDDLIYFEDNYNYKCVLLDSLSFVIQFAFNYGIISSALLVYGLFFRKDKTSSGNIYEDNFF